MPHQRTEKKSGDEDPFTDLYSEDEEELEGFIYEFG